MKKILLLILMSSFIFSDVSIIQINKYRDSKKLLLLGDKYNKDFIEKVSKVWKKNITETGEAKLSFIIKARKGKIIKINKGKPKGNRAFKKELKKFIEEVKHVRLKRMKSKYEEITIKTNLSFKKIEKEKEKFPISIYKEKSGIMYNKYVSYLKYSKGYSLDYISKLLKTNKKIVSKMMLNAIYYDYVKDDINEAGKYYDIIINTKIKRFIGNREGLFLVDYLLREKEYDLILEILPEFTCEFIKSPEKYQCYYFRAQALYRTENPDYRLPLNKSIKYIKQARILKETIKKEEKIKRKKRR